MSTPDVHSPCSELKPYIASDNYMVRLGMDSQLITVRHRLRFFTSTFATNDSRTTRGLHPVLRRDSRQHVPKQPQHIHASLEHQPQRQAIALPNTQDG
jgi:hypothetical protein